MSEATRSPPRPPGSPSGPAHWSRRPTPSRWPGCWLRRSTCSCWWPGAPRGSTSSWGSSLAASDGLDGYIARRHGTTRSGAFLDPLADKACVLAAMITLCVEGHLPWLPVILIAIREVGMQLYRSWVGRAACPSRPANRPRSRRWCKTWRSVPSSSRRWPISTRCRWPRSGSPALDALHRGRVPARRSACAAPPGRTLRSAPCGSRSSLSGPSCCWARSPTPIPPGWASTWRPMAWRPISTRPWATTTTASRWPCARRWPAATASSCAAGSGPPRTTSPARPSPTSWASRSCATRRSSTSSRASSRPGAAP